MGRFSYKAVNKAGTHIAGTIEAPDRRSAVAGLAGDGRFVLELTEDAQASTAAAGKTPELNLGRFIRFGSRRVSRRDILGMTSQLGTALRAGLPLLNCLEIIRDQQHKTAMRKMLDQLVGSVSSGKALSEALAEHQRLFSPLYLSMIRVGETGGILEQTTTQLATLLARDEKTRASMRNASVYPVFVLGLGMASVVVIITWILPRILNTIVGGFEVLPWPTKMLIVLSGFIRTYGLLLAVVIVVAGGWFRRWLSSGGRLPWDAFKLRIPILGSVLRSIAVGRFARTLGALTKGGVTILESLSVVRDTLGNELLGREIDNVADKVRSGAPMAEPLAVSGYFPPLLVQIVSIGEQTGKLDELLLNAAETFDEEADSAITRFMAIFPAILILLLALVILFIIAATLLPIVMMELGAGGMTL